MGWIWIARDWLSHPDNIVTLLTACLSLIATGISVLAYRRGSPPVMPRAWASFHGRLPGATVVTLHVENHTDGTILVNSVRSPGRKLGVNGRGLPADRKDWEPATHFEYDWVDEDCFSLELTPGQFGCREISVSSVDPSESAKLSLILSISTMRRTIKTRAMTIAVTIPAVTAK